MCIIMYAPKGIVIPEKFIENAFYNNPDGAGMMYYQQDKKGEYLVHYKKGYFDLENFLKDWRAIPKDVPRAIHCRIATSGKISTACCHPFPIEDSAKKMCEGEGIAYNGCLMHNGVLHDYEPVGKMKAEYSDTMMFTEDLVYDLNKVLTNIGVQQLVEEKMQTERSRLLIFDKDLQVYMFGTWLKDKKGFYTSNESYQDTPTYSPYGYKYSTYIPCAGAAYTTGTTGTKKSKTSKSTNSSKSKGTQNSLFNSGFAYGYDEGYNDGYNDGYSGYEDVIDDCGTTEAFKKETIKQASEGSVTTTNKKTETKEETPKQKETVKVATK